MMARTRTVTFTQREVEAIRSAIDTRLLEIADQYDTGHVTRAIDAEAKALDRVLEKLAVA